MDEMQTLVDGALRTLRDNARAFNDDSALDRARAFFHALDWKARARCCSRYTCSPPSRHIAIAGAAVAAPARLRARARS